MTEPTARRARLACAALPLLAAGILSGCTLAPTYERPALPVADGYPADVATSGVATSDVATSGVAASAGSRIAADIGWREFFGDPRLQALIATALENNRDLRIAAARIEEARAQYSIQGADQWPTLNATASGNRARVPASVSASGRDTVTSSYGAGVGLAAFELDFFGRVRSLNDAALAQFLASEEARRAAQISLVAEVAKAYFAERAYAEQLALARRTLEGRERAWRLAQQRFEVGASSALDLRLNETLMLQARTAAAALARQQAQAANALALLAGRHGGDLPAPRPLSAQDIVADLPAGLPSDLLVQRPDVRAAEQRLRAANASIGAARAAFLPRISLTAATGSISNELSGLFESGSRNWSFVPQLIMPIFDAGRTGGNLTLAHARKNIAIAEYERSIQAAFRDVADALAGRATLDEQLAAQQAAYDAQADRARLAELRFANGIASSIDVLDAQRELFNAEQQLVQVRLQRLSNAVDLYRALGGGLNEQSGGVPASSR